jgi:hypothetical protein
MFFLQKNEDATSKKLFFMILFGIICLIFWKVEKYLEKKFPPIEKSDY